MWMAEGGGTKAVAASRVEAVRGLRAHYDWAKVAEAILAREGAQGAGTMVATAPEEHGAIKGARVIGHDYSRTGAEGGAAGAGLKDLWRYAPEDTLFLSTPAVVGKRIYAGGCVAELGSYSGVLVCLDGETGKPLWTVDEVKGLDGRTGPLKPVFSSPAVTADGKYVVVGQGLHQDKNCSMMCFEAETGALKWQVGTSLHIESSAAIVGDVAVIGAGAIEGPDGRATGDPGQVIAVRISDGKELWRVRVIDPESAPAMDEEGNVYIGSAFNGEAVVALSGKDGKELWKREVGLPVTSPVTIDGELVIAGSGNSNMVQSAPDARGEVVALDKKTGAVKWRTAFADSVLGGIPVKDGLVICPVRTGEVVALSEADGKVVWRSRVSGNAPVAAGCAFAGDRVYAVSNDGYLGVLDAKDGHVVEKVFLNDQAKPGTGLTIGDPQVVKGRVIVGSETGGLHVMVGGGK
jgi:outer membrane protein assembly factor BamB